jgi:hypothetical protein
VVVVVVVIAPGRLKSTLAPRALNRRDGGEEKLGGSELSL